MAVDFQLASMAQHLMHCLPSALPKPAAGLLQGCPARRMQLPCLSCHAAGACSVWNAAAAVAADVGVTAVCMDPVTWSRDGAAHLKQAMQQQQTRGVSLHPHLCSAGCWAAGASAKCACMLSHLLGSRCSSRQGLHAHLCSAAGAQLWPAALQAAGQQVQQRAARELHVEPPFALACRVSAAARRQSLLVRSSSPDGAPALAPEATVLPVGEPAVLSATLRVTAPCEVSSELRGPDCCCCLWGQQLLLVAACCPASASSSRARWSSFRHEESSSRPHLPISGRTPLDQPLPASSRGCKHQGWQSLPKPAVCPTHARPSRHLQASGVAPEGEQNVPKPAVCPVHAMPCRPGRCRLQVQLLGVEVAALEGEQQQASVLESVTALTGQAPVTLRTGDRHRCLFRVWHDEASRSLPLGHLRVTWRRPRWVAGARGRLGTSRAKAPCAPTPVRPMQRPLQPAAHRPREVPPVPGEQSTGCHKLPATDLPVGVITVGLLPDQGVAALGRDEMGAETGAHRSVLPAGCPMRQEPVQPASSRQQRGRERTERTDRKGPRRRPCLLRQRSSWETCLLWCLCCRCQKWLLSSRCCPQSCGTLSR